MGAGESAKAVGRGGVGRFFFYRKIWHVVLVVGKGGVGEF